MSAYRIFKHIETVSAKSQAGYELIVITASGLRITGAVEIINEYFVALRVGENQIFLPLDKIEQVIPTWL